MATLAETLWHIFAADHQSFPPGTTYRYDNAGRDYGATVLCQLTLIGSLDFHTASGTRQIEPGQVMLTCAGDASVYGLPQPHPLHACIWVELAGAGLTELWHRLRERHGTIATVADPTALAAAMRTLVELERSPRRAGMLAEASEVHAFVLRLVEILEVDRQRAATPIERAIADLLEHPFDPTPLAVRCRRQAVSREHVARVFAVQHGQGPAQWLRARRLERARLLLAETPWTVAEVARRCGFSSAHHLARVLRQTHGSGPRAQRSRSTRAP